MRLFKNKSKRRGFTMIELLVAVTITTIIITVLVGMTRVAMDAWSDSRDRIKASRVAKESLDKISRDLEGIIVRSGNVYEWAVVKSDSGNSDGPTSNTQLANPTEMIFFTGATDRYSGEIGTDVDLGGDVSAVSYSLVFQDQLDPSGNNFPVFALYRNLVNPNEVFENLLAQEDLGAEYASLGAGVGDTTAQNNFLVENIFDLTLTFIFEYDEAGVTRYERVPVIATGDVKEVRIFGDRVEIDGSVLTADGTSNKITRLSGAELSVFVLPDRAMNALRRQPINSDTDFSEYLRKNGYHYSKSVILPRP